MPYDINTTIKYLISVWIVSEVGDLLAEVDEEGKPLLRHGAQEPLRLLQIHSCLSTIHYCDFFFFLHNCKKITREIFLLSMYLVNFVVFPFYS